MEKTTKTDVVIIGAGPTGLALACHLSRYGIDFMIIDKNEGVTPYSKAIGVHARTLEIYEQLGLAAEAIARGTRADRVHLYTEGLERGVVELGQLGQGLSPYPFVLLLEQSKNEQLLYEYLQGQQRDVRWRTTLERLSQTDTEVWAQVSTADGTRQTIEAKYLVGCDGARSTVRRELGLGFEGSTFERTFYVADAQIDWQFSHDALRACLSRGTFTIFFPLQGKQRYRIVGVFPEEYARAEGEVLYEEIEQRIKQEAKLDLDIHDVEWFSTYRVHTRHVSKFCTGLCFLAGDAAHIHSPAGAQGMNTGIQDSYNLAWKLALVLQGKAGEKLLSTYHEERLENARNLLETTDRMFQFAANPEWFFAYFRTRILPSIAKYILKSNAVKNFIFPLLSQIGITYRNSSLSQHTGDENFNVKAGDRMPYLLINGASIYDRLHTPNFHWLHFADSQSASSTSEAEAANRYGGLIDFLELPLTPEVQEVFGTTRPFSVLLRPDNYLGMITPEAPLSVLPSYLNEVIGRPSPETILHQS